MTFELFPYLSDDLKLQVLSFAADAPFESRYNQNSPNSTMTHCLPQVSRKFRTLAASDYFWKQAIVRQLKNEPFLWKRALCRMIASVTKQPDLDMIEAEFEQEEEAFVVEAMKCKKYCSFKSMYQDIVTHHLRYSGPVFCMGGQVTIGVPYSLHFFEPRYRSLIAQVMKNQPAEAKQGGRVILGHDNATDPLFVHANRGPLQPTTPATLVRVQRCELMEDGRANVELLPVAHVWLEKLWQQEESLHMAQCLQMGQAATHSMNQLVRQEQLQYVMTQLHDTLSAEQRSGRPAGYSSSSGWSSSGWSSSGVDESS